MYSIETGCSKKCQIPTLGEIYNDCFGYITDGTFVEVGANDGESFSNTSFLADLGWYGHYIEPVPAYYKQCMKRHSKNENTHVYNFAIGDSEKQVTLHIGGVLSTIDETALEIFSELEWSKRLFKGETIEVSQIELNKFLETYKIKPNFEVLVVDVEGMEWDVVKSFDLEIWKPQMAIIELHDENDNYLKIRDKCISVREKFEQADYEILFKDLTNTIFFKKW